MKLRMMIGIVGVLLSISILNSCTKIEPDNEFVELNSSFKDTDNLYVKKYPTNPENELKEFGQVQTKATMTPTWSAGDMLCVFSLDENDIILFKDTCTVYNINKDKGKITAEVAKNCTRYFSCYPYNHIKGEIGDKLDLSQEGYIYRSGNFGDESVMTSFCPQNGNTFNFENRYSLFRINGIISSNFPIKINWYLTNGEVLTREYTSFNGDTFYSAIWFEDITINRFELTYRKRSGFSYRETKVTKYPKEKIIPAHVYSYSLTSL